MISELPHFTVIIPCKNRASYLKHTLRTCMIQNYKNLEIIVSDDGSTDNLREVVEEAMRSDSRIRYVQPSTGTGMLNNFEFALKQVKPGFVIALGGDDGLLPNGIQGMCDILLQTGMELLAWPAPAYYYPNTRGISGQLCIYREKGIKIIDSNQFLAEQAKNLSYSSDLQSPMFYVKGVVSTKLIERVRQRTSNGQFYSCPTPDGYSGIVLAGEVSKYAYSGRPFSIFGVSPTSQGLTYLSNKEEDKKISENFFKSAASRPMHQELASQQYSPLISLMTVDYLLTAKDLPGWSGSFPDIDYKEVILKGLNELSFGLYGEDRVTRELNILYKIAIKHGLDDFFRKKVRSSKRYIQRSPFTGNGIGYGKKTYGFYLDGDAYQINDIFDAAYAAQNISFIYSDLTSWKTLTSAIVRSIAFKLRSMRKGKPFPHESEWRQLNS
jgi:glycosyltransferase involved in cell wall biosynthesis